MGKAVLMSLNPQWFQPIMSGMKTKEVRKRAPLLRPPYKVYLYCTKGCHEAWRAGVTGKSESYRMNGTVCGEFICESTMDDTPPWKSLSGTYLTARELFEYAGGADKLSFMSIRNPILYDKPKRLEDFGLKHPPLSWQYVEIPCESD